MRSLWNNPDAQGVRIIIPPFPPDQEILTWNQGGFDLVVTATDAVILGKQCSSSLADRALLHIGGSVQQERHTE